jgi:hypothetical protein
VPASGTITPAAYPSATVLSTGTALITGGFGSAGELLSSALTIPVGDSSTTLSSSSPMMFARARHAIAPATFATGDGALVIGGLATGSVAPVMEQFVQSGFTEFDVPSAAGTVENRSYAQAVGLGPGVLLIGGTIPNASGVGVATDSVLYITTGATPTVSRYSMATGNAVLSTARAHHSATQVGSQILVCGGIDENGASLASCDLIDTSPMLKFNKTIQTGNARYDHAAVQLETGPVLLVGGLTTPGVPLQSIEIYTPETVLTPPPTTTTTTTAATISFTLRK